MAVVEQHGVRRLVVQRLGVQQDAIHVEDHGLRGVSRRIAESGRTAPELRGRSRERGHRTLPPGWSLLLMTKGLASVSLPASSLGSCFTRGA